MELALAIASFLIAIVGILLQISGAFPEHKEVRKTIVTISIGLFLGVGISSLLNADLQITGNVDNRYALLFSLVGIAFFFGIVATVVPDDKRRNIAATSAGIATFIFLACGLAIGINASVSGGPPTYEVTTDELVLLANAAEQRRAYGEAIGYLERLRHRNLPQAAYPQIRTRIQRLEALQLQLTGQTEDLSTHPDSMPDSGGEPNSVGVNQAFP